jgi:hypothetical protein
MSYEGREVWLCANGHRRDFDCYNAPNDTEGTQRYHCPCRAPWVWSESIDQTNCEGVESVLVVHRSAVTETCAHCGTVKQLEEVRYCIPSNSGHQLKGAEPTVPFFPVRFRAEGSTEEFCTEGEAYQWIVDRHKQEESENDQ